jgi:two-component sensor histidine kinase
MGEGNGGNGDPQHLHEAPHLADALESDRFRQFLDHVPFGVIVAELRPTERIVYANLEFERLTGQSVRAIEGRPWQSLPLDAAAAESGRQLRDAITEGEDYIGVFSLRHAEEAPAVHAWSNVIVDDNGTPLFRLVVLARFNALPLTDELEAQLREKDTLLRELQHRVKNNLQMITALIRLEARNVADESSSPALQRLAGRVEALAMLYRLLAEAGAGGEVDLGVYLSEIASAVMKAHAVPGIRLDLKVDAWPVSINVAMPTGLVVNEVLTNSLKYAFAGREGGTITLRSLVDETGCRVTIGDDGIGMAEGAVWPKPGRLGALIVDSLRENAKARITMETAPEKGVRVAIVFDRADAAPPAAGASAG